MAFYLFVALVTGDCSDNGSPGHPGQRGRQGNQGQPGINGKLGKIDSNISYFMHCVPICHNFSR